MSCHVTTAGIIRIRRQSGALIHCHCTETTSEFFPYFSIFSLQHRRQRHDSPWLSIVHELVYVAHNFRLGIFIHYFEVRFLGPL